MPTISSARRSGHPLLPSDFTPEEYKIAMYAVENLYRKLEDITDKFIVSMCYDNKYDQTVVARCLNISDAAVSKRIKNIKAKLKILYKRS